jgi:2-dehydro-3-deoxy-D-arabinonate dehydratase
MRIMKFKTNDDPWPQFGVVRGDSVLAVARGELALSEFLHSDEPSSTLDGLLASSGALIPNAEVSVLAPLDRQEVWGAGVTYERSKVAREQESDQAASFYDLVYRAERPELFFKATPSRVVAPFQPVRVRRDSNWCVPEPELALVLSPKLKLVGFTAGNDMSARDIEGENPLYLPQAKVYDACCALGPVITLADAMPSCESTRIVLEIDRAGATIFQGETSLTRMARRLDDLIDWLGRENQFPNGVILLTGTGIVPPDDFSLRAGDVVRITIDGIGTLTNPVIKGTPAS